MPTKFYPRIPKYVTDWDLYDSKDLKKPVTVSLFGVEFSSLELPSLSTMIGSFAPMLKPVLNMLKAIQAILAIIEALVTLDLDKIGKIVEGLAETLIEITLYFSQFTAAGFVPTALKTVVSMLEFIKAMLEYIYGELAYLKEAGDTIDSTSEYVASANLSKDALQEVSDILKRVKEENYLNRRNSMIPFEIIGTALSIADTFLGIIATINGQDKPVELPDLTSPDVEESLDKILDILRDAIEKISNVIYTLDVFGS